MIIKSILKSSLPKNTWQNLRRQRENLRHLFTRFLRLLKRPNIYNIDTQERVGLIFYVDTHLSIDERFLLYSLVRGIRPKNILEIGVLHGASSVIIAAALEDIGQGTIVGLDPSQNIKYPEKLFFGRFKMVEMPSPEGIGKASEVAGGLFEMIHFDSINAHDPLEADIAGCLPYMADPAYLLINNSIHYGVNQAIQEAVDSTENLHDCGFIAATGRIVTGENLAHGTLRLLRISSNSVADPQSIINTAFKKEGIPAPSYDPELINHDPWYCRVISPCPRCLRILRDK